MHHKVFVYGTLKRNERNHHWLTNPGNGVGKFIGNGTTKQKYPLITATRRDTPFLLYSPGNGHFVKGEIYEVDDVMFGKLDLLEDHPNFYIREIDDITLEKDSSTPTTEKCWVYFLKAFRPELLKKQQLESFTSSANSGLPYAKMSEKEYNDFKSEVMVVTKMHHKVFVYGTLKRNEPNHHWLTDPDNGVGKFIGNGTTKQKYPLIIATRYNIPFLLYSPGNGHFVKGEIYEVDDTMLGKLDILEDHPNYYIREIDDITLEKDSSTPTMEKCWVYFLKTFRPELMKKEQFESYSSSANHGLPYVESNNESTIDDLDEGFDSVFKKD